MTLCGVPVYGQETNVCREVQLLESCSLVRNINPATSSCAAFFLSLCCFVLKKIPGVVGSKEEQEWRDS